MGVLTVDYLQWFLLHLSVLGNPPIQATYIQHQLRDHLWNVWWIESYLLSPKPDEEGDQQDHGEKKGFVSTVCAGCLKEDEWFNALHARNGFTINVSLFRNPFGKNQSLLGFVPHVRSNWIVQPCTCTFSTLTPVFLFLNYYCCCS